MLLFTGRRRTEKPQATTTSRIATMKKAAIATPKSPNDAAMLFVVATASAGTSTRRAMFSALASNRRCIAAW